MNKNLPVVLLPGHMCDTRTFNPQLAAMLGRPTSTGDFTRDATIEGMARRLLADAPAQFILLGHSMGGIIAFEILRQAPQRVARLALFDVNPQPETSLRREERLAMLDELAAGKLQLEDIVRLRFLPNYLGADNANNHGLREQLVGTALELGPEVLDRQTRALVGRADSQPLLANIGVPTLLLCGREDKLCQSELHEMMAAEIPGATLAIIEGAGHFPMLERPQQVNRVLEAWLKS
jgi:pimeloyl-ACP methyl ester carboxylesterase